MRRLKLLLILCCSSHTFWLFAAPQELLFEREVDFGQVHHGVRQKIHTLLTNTSANLIKIDHIKTSCGCTSVELFNHDISAQSNLQLTFELDTLQKVGQIRKSVRIYFKDDPSPTLMYLTGEVLPQPKQHMSIQTDKGIFSENCASCHVNPGQNKRGQALYLADCAMCHGTFKTGASAPPLLPSSLKPDWKDTLIKGKNLMPAFSSEHQGPLTSQQIDSLVDLLSQESQPSDYQSKAPALNYYRWCAPCHGTDKMGPIGPDLRSESLQHWSHASLFELLKNGRNSIMPSFHLNHNGPFNDEELQRLVDYLIGPVSK